MIYFKGQINENESASTPDSTNYDDQFEYLNLKSAWSHDVFIAQEPVYDTFITSYIFKTVKLKKNIKQA